MGMKVPVQIFREYDIRGVADRDLTDELVQAIGASFGTMIRGEKVQAKIALARDCRLSSDRMHTAVVKGLTSVGCQVIDVGIGPTPMLYFAAHHLETDGAMMITGSHNPAGENGVKMMKGKAPFFGQDIISLRERIEKQEFSLAAGSIQTASVEQPYLEALHARIKMGPHPVNVVLDAGNGAGGPLGLQATRALGVEVEPLYCEMDGRFPNHHPDPTQPDNLKELIRLVKERKAHVGLAYDGDADRLGAIDANGDIIWGDKLLMLFARDILKEHPGASVVGEVKCSQTTYDDIERHGGRAILWKTGHSLIKKKMKEEHALLAGEMSGHLFFADRWFGFDDALYAGMRLVEILSKEGKTIGELLADVPKTSITPELRVECADDKKFQVVAGVLEHYRATTHKVIDVDGARILFGDGAWGLVRASNTQPVLVMRFEAQNDERRDEIRAQVEQVVTTIRERG
jgi:phosphomannomutase / phosphoglucomutase